ncbi:MAG: CHASE domain-containing protein [Vicinamibacterales bacterium]
MQLGSLFAAWRQRTGRPLVPFTVLALGLVATAVTAYFSHSTGLAKDRSRFEAEVASVRDTVVTRIDTYIALLRAGAGLFAGSSEVTREEFRAFVDRLELRTRYPGIQGIGFSVRVPAANLAQMVRAIRSEGMPGFSVWPAYERPFYYPIVYLEPMDRRNQAAIGYDMFTEPVRREAMDRAARRAFAAASGRVRLVQEIDREVQPGFLIYVPVYSTGLPPAGEAARLQTLRGFIYSPFRAGDFLESVLGGTEHELLHVHVYDGLEEKREALLFETEGPGIDSGGLEAKVTVDVAGRPWLLAFWSRPGFEAASERRLVPAIIGLGTGVSLLLFLATMVEARARSDAERVAEELRQSEEKLRARELDLHRLVEAERQAHAAAAAANRAKDDFLATLSHELRTPLNAILGWTSMLLAGQVSPEQHQHALSVIARNARTQAELIEDLLDVSRIITGKLRIEMRPILLAHSIQAAIDALRPTAEVKGVDLEWHQATDGPVLGDPDRLQQVAWNLLANAIKFTPPGGRVVATLRQQGPEVEFRVADTGVGLAPEFLPFVFERFSQRDSSTTRKHGGMGLGLAIARHLVESHGGTVHAESSGEGMGATFTVMLPLRALAVRETPADAVTRAAGTPGLGSVRALVVEDDADARDLVAGALSRAGAETSVATSVAEAMEAIDRERFDVVVADIAMPDADGYELIRRMRSHPSDWVRAVPAVAVTAYARPEDRDQAKAAGFQVHLAKPIDVNALLEAVRQAAGV